MNRLALLAFAVGIFITVLLLGWVEPQTGMLIGAALIVGLLFLVRVSPVKTLILGFSRNTLLVIFGFLAFVSFTLTISNWPDPVLLPKPQKGEYRPGDDAQRMRNISRGLGSKTDRELDGSEDRVAIPFDSWIVRWICTWVLIGFTVIYLPIAVVTNVRNALGRDTSNTP